MPLIAATAISHCPITGVHVITQKGVHDISSGKRDSAFIVSSLPQRPALQPFSSSPSFVFKPSSSSRIRRTPDFTIPDTAINLPGKTTLALFFFFSWKKINANLNPKPALDLLQ